GVHPTRAERHAASLAQYAADYGVLDSPQRVAHCLAQLMAESGSFRWASELWGPTAAQKRYEGRADLGNVHPGDGSRYRGRGLLQTTGRANYRALTRHVRARFGEGPAFEAQPHLVADPPWAALSAFAWWVDNRATRTSARLDTAAALLAVNLHVNLGNPDSGRTPNGYAHRLDAFPTAASAVRKEAGKSPAAPLDRWPQGGLPEPEPPDGSDMVGSDM